MLHFLLNTKIIKERNKEYHINFTNYKEWDLLKSSKSLPRKAMLWIWL